MKRALLLLVLAGLPASHAVCQDLTGVITGTVTDSSGAVVPGASVTILRLGTETPVWEGKTASSGQYLAPLLPVGQYDIRIQLQGFRKTEIKDFDLKVDQRARIDAVLQPGEIKDSVTVTGENVVQLETETSSMALVINPAQVRDLPMANRAVFSLITLSAGVSTGDDPTVVDSSQYSINGSRSQSSEITIDGVSVFGGATGAISHLPSPDAVREVKVLTSAYSAEYGRTAGATISMVVNSGTNTYHGAVYEYFRNEDLNANNFFNNLRGTPRPPNRQNQIGGSFSGPVWLPKVYRGKDRTFFFANYETTRQTVPGAPISTIPGLAFRSGDFSSSSVVVADPSTHVPLPGNRIPVSRLDPAAVKIMNLLPAPDSPGTLDPSTGIAANNYINNVSKQPYTNNLTTRLDHTAGKSTSLWLRFTHDWADTPRPETIPGPLNPGSPESQTTQWIGAAGLTKPLTPTLFAEARFSYLRSTVAALPPSFGVDVAQTLGIQRSPLAATPMITMTGWAALGSQNNVWQTPVDNIFQFAPALTWIRGTHSLKAGMELRKNQYNNFNGNSNYAGLYNFNGNLKSPSSTSGSPINSLADLLFGAITNAAYAVPQPEIARRNYNLAFFLQDDWKVSRKLTLNLGLRQDYEAPQTTANGVYSRVDPFTGKLLVAGRNSDASLGLHPPLFNFGPRAGFAYALDSKTVVRSAFGMFFYQLFSNLGGNVVMPGFNATATFNSAGKGIAQPFTLAQGMPLSAVAYQNPLDAQAAATVSNPLVPSNSQYAETNHLPTIMQWNFGIQRQLARGTVLDLSYVGNHDVHLPLALRFNALPSFAIGELVNATGNNVSTQQYRPFPTISSGWNAVTNVGSSKYHSLQVRATREISNSVSFQMNYTFAKSTDDGSGTFANTQPNGTLDSQFPQIARNLDHAVSVFDRKHTLVLAPQYTTSLGPKYLRGIAISAIFTARTGLPSTIYQSNLYPDVIQQRPDLTGDGRLLYASAAVTNGTGIQYLRPPSDPQFPLSPTGPLFLTVGSVNKMLLPASVGTLGRDVIRNHGDANVNFSINRRFRLKERMSMQIRMDAFNALNHTNLSIPNTSLLVTADSKSQTAIFSSPGYGLITTAKSARFMQLSARIDF